MELRDLRTFLQTIDSGTITAAAGELHLVQSAVSRAIKRLEDEFGLTLLERTPDGVTPTPAGADFARHAEAILAGVAAAESDMAAHRDSASGRVRVGFLTSVVPLLLAPLLRRLRAATRTSAPSSRRGCRSTCSRASASGASTWP